MAAISYQEILIINARDKLLNKDTGGSSRIFAAISVSLSESPFVQRQRFCVYETPLLPAGPLGQNATWKSARQDYVTWSSTPGLLKRDSFSWSSENRERSQIARTIFYGGSIFLTKCPAPTDVEWDYVAWNETDSLDLHAAGERCFRIKRVLQKLWAWKNKMFNRDGSDILKPR